jgi:hypothetical protein
VLRRGLLWILLPLGWLAILGGESVRGGEGSPGQKTAATDASYAVTLICGSSVPLSAASSSTLAARALDLVQSSQSNSQLPDWHFPVSEVEEEFRGALRSKHLQISFHETHTIESTGGTLLVREVIVRLAQESRPSFPDRFVDSVFTIDDKGDIVGHALYSGVRAVALWRAVIGVTGSSDQCGVPKHFPGFY